jgi:hypothetical protein
MKDQFVTYEIAARLKELGFNEPCFGAFDGQHLISGNNVYPTVRQKTFGYTNDGTYVSCAAPLWQQAIDWLISNNIQLSSEKTEHGYLWTIKSSLINNKKNKLQILCSLKTRWLESHVPAIEKALTLIK